MTLVNGGNKPECDDLVRTFAAYGYQLDLGADDAAFNANLKALLGEVGFNPAAAVTCFGSQGCSYSMANNVYLDAKGHAIAHRDFVTRLDAYLADR